MSEQETTAAQGNVSPDDNRLSGPGGGEQPAMLLNTDTPMRGFNQAPTGADNRFDDSPNASTAAPDRELAPEDMGTTKPIDDPKRVRAETEEHFGAGTYILKAGTELFNQSGACIVLRSDAPVSLTTAGGEPRANDTRFAGFLHDSDKNWALNIGQLERPFNRATCTPLPLMCEKHGEDIEIEPYGAPRQCPKCAEEALAAAQEIAAQPPPPASQSEEAMREENERQAALAREEELRRDSILPEG